MPHTIAMKVALSVTGFNFALYGVTADSLFDLLFTRLYYAAAVSFVTVPIAILLTYFIFFCIYKRFERTRPKQKHVTGR